MDLEILKRIVLDQHEVIKKSNIIKRDYILEDDVCYVLVGLRRAGKSTLLYSKVIDYINKGISWEQIIYINFEDERLSEFTSNDFNDILILKNQLTSKKTYFFFDEIQNIENWEKFARRLADSHECVCITGSNSKMLSNEIAAKLGGRYISKFIMPYNFCEFLNARNIDVDTSTKTLGLINSAFNDYINYGGLPDILNYNDKREYLRSVYDKVLLNDVILHNKIRNERYIKIFVKKIAEVVKDETSYTKLDNIMKSIGFSSSKETIISYLSYLVEANLIFEVKNYYATFVEKERTPKYYFSDNGILNLFLNDKMGILFENLVAIFLKRQGYEFYYLKSSKTGIDIDFYIPDDFTLIQVSLSIDDIDTYTREIKELIKFKNKSKDNNRYIIITKDTSKIIEMDNMKIEVINIFDLLINNKL